MIAGIIASHYVPQDAYAAAVLADSPLGYWRLNEASGTAMADSSGSGRNGTYSGVDIPRTSLLTSSTDTAADFNGTTAYAQVVYSSWMDTASLTVEALFKLDTTGAYRTIASHDSGTGTPRAFLFRVSDTNKLQAVLWTTSTGPHVVTGATTISAGTTYHAALTHNGSTVTLWLNGSSDATLSVAGSLRTSSANFWIGAGNNGGGARELLFDGILDEVALYGTALSGARIAAHYAAA